MEKETLVEGCGFRNKIYDCLTSHLTQHHQPTRAIGSGIHSDRGENFTSFTFESTFKANVELIDFMG